MQTWIKSSAKLFNSAYFSNFKGLGTGTNNDLRWSVSHQSVTGYIPLPCTNKTLHGWEEGSHLDCCTQSELLHYTKALAFIWPLAHHSPKKHCFGSQEVSMFLAAHCPHSLYQNFILQSQGTQERKTDIVSLSQQVSFLLSHRTVRALLYAFTDFQSGI